MVGRLEQLGVEVLDRGIEDGQDVGLVQEVRADRVEDRPAAEDRADAAWVGLEEDAVGRTVDRVVRGRGARGERAGADGERHGSMVADGCPGS